VSESCPAPQLIAVRSPSSDTRMSRPAPPPIEEVAPLCVRTWPKSFPAPSDVSAERPAAPVITR
jgi:hypothetical protein